MAPELPTRLELPVGARHTLKLSPSSNVVKLSLTSEGDTLTVRSISDSEWLIKAPYSELNSSLRLEVTCASTSTSGIIPIQTRLPRWERLYSWKDGDPAFPKNREYPAARRLDRKWYMRGGFAYIPKQFTVSNDTWVFDLDTDSCSALPSQPNAPAFAGANLIPIPGSQGLATLGGINPEFQPLWHFDILNLTAHTWSSSKVIGAPVYGAYQAGVFLDDKRNRYLQVCGQSGPAANCKVASLRIRDDGQWEWNNEPLASGTTPAGRTGFAYAWDAENQRFIVFGGNVSEAGATIGDTWALEIEETPMRWVKLLDDAPTLMRRNSAFTIDG